MKNFYRRIWTGILFLAVLLGSMGYGEEVSVYAAGSENVLSVRGVDLSSIVAFEDAGTSFYYENGTKGDIFAILADAGVNYVRIRIWNDPYDASTGMGYGGGNNDLSKAVEIGQRAAAYGMKAYINFQYSDFWADPAKQYAPKAWMNYTAAQKAQAIYDFTYSSLQTLLNAGVDVGMVQIGNETNGAMCGMGGLYDGVWNLTTGVGDALQKGCEAVAAINVAYNRTGDNKILRVLHFTDPVTTASWYAEQADVQGIEYDVFSVSAYPFWFGSASDLEVTLKSIASTYDKKVMVAETAYPYTFINGDDTSNNINSVNDMTYMDYEVSVAGQKAAIRDIFSAVAGVNGQAGTEGYGLGGFYWEPSWIGSSRSNGDTYGTGWASSVSENYERLYSSVKNEYSTIAQGSSWDNMAMFDSNGKALSSLQVFNEFSSNSNPY